MNPTFIRTLKSMSHVEKDNTFKLRHGKPPDTSTAENVIVVSSSSGILPSKRSDEWHLPSLTEALELSCSGNASRILIVVHEGTYFLDTLSLRDGKLRDGRLALEIVGVGQVRLVWMGGLKVDFGGIHVYGKIDITFQNLTLFSRCLFVNYFAILSIHEQATASFQNVLFDMPNRICLDVTGNEKWRIENLFMKNCVVKRCKQCLSIDNSEAVLDQCHFTGIGWESKSIDIDSSQVKFIECSFHYTCVAMVLSRSRANVVADKCRFAQSVNKAFGCELNANLTVTRCIFELHLILELALNVKGRVKFCNNKTVWVPWMLKDAMSITPIHDFVNLKLDYDPLQAPPCKVNCKKISENSDLFCSAENQDQFRYERGFVIKACRYCGIYDCIEDNKPKFLWCARCKEACYCSKHCQTKDWRDHKLECRENG